MGRGCEERDAEEVGDAEVVWFWPYVFDLGRTPPGQASDSLSLRFLSKIPQLLLIAMEIK